MTDNNIRQTGETQQEYGFMLLKTEKLSVAIHIVTGHLSVQEPLREDLRRTALRLVRDVRALASGENGEIMSDTSHLKNDADAIISGLYVAKSSRMISEGNVTILEREYHALGDCFASNKLGILDRVSHDEKPAISASRNSIGHQSGRVVVSVMPRKTPTKPPEGLSRREIILNIIEAKNSYSLSDVASRVAGVSEKTIQRDLLGLVAEKILKKTGERRWSRYARA